jgi:hypothetical protein
MSDAHISPEIKPQLSNSSLTLVNQSTRWVLLTKHNKVDTINILAIRKQETHKLPTAAIKCKLISFKSNSRPALFLFSST